MIDFSVTLFPWDLTFYEADGVVAGFWRGEPNPWDDNRRHISFLEDRRVRYILLTPVSDEYGAMYEGVLKCLRDRVEFTRPYWCHILLFRKTLKGYVLVNYTMYKPNQVKLGTIDVITLPLNYEVVEKKKRRGEAEASYEMRPTTLLRGQMSRSL